jgi:hypothetical protein
MESIEFNEEERSIGNPSILVAYNLMLMELYWVNGIIVDHFVGSGH